MINSGELKHKIDIQNLIITQDSELNPIESWVTFISSWAGVVPKGGREFYKLQNVNNEITEIFKIRYIKLDPRMRIKFKCKYYQIIDIINVDEANKELLITCKGMI